MIGRFIKYVKDAINDPERDFSERVFLLLTIVSEITAIMALIGDIIFKENIGEIIVLWIIVLSVPIVTFTCLYKNKIRFAIGLIVFGVVFFIMPSIFFFGAGVEGGAVLWIIFAFLYIGLVVSGKWRRIMLVFLFLVTSVCYLVQYYHPELMQPHSRRMFYIDSFISIILVGLECFAMIWFQNRLFMDENARARKAAETAEDLTKAQNRFFSSMSHEIRTPINSILGLNELILRDQDASEEVIKDATGIKGAGNLLLALINDILDFSKMGAGGMDVVPVDYHVEDMVAEIVNMMWLKAGDKGLAFEVGVDPSTPSVLYGDEIRIKQIIINLLNNAIKYTPKGSVKFDVEFEEIDEKKGTFKIIVTDTGIGIKKEVLPGLFDVFKRVDEEKNRHIEGTGLGLSIVKQLAELMDGNIEVSSVYGEGSRFTVSITQNISDPTPIGEINIHNRKASKSHGYESSFRAPEASILIVDDNEMNLEVEKKLLKETGMTIDTVLSGKEALKKAVENHYDVILMDHLMPEMNGIECLKQLRGQTGGLNRTTPVIVVTANAGSENRSIYNAAGFDGYLVKPVSGASLEDILIKHISKDKLILSEKMSSMSEDINTGAAYSRKAPVIITMTSMSDLPDTIIKKLNIPVISFLITTEEGVFKDTSQMEAGELIRYINSGKSASSSPPDIKTHTEFFAKSLKKAHHLIHIALTTSMSRDYNWAQEAAASFDNVTVINSECLSSATGLLVLIACKLAQQNIPVPEIIDELEAVKKRLRCSFVVDNTEYMAKKGYLSERINRIARAINLHLSLRFRNDKFGVGSLWIGSTKMAYKSYIRSAFPSNANPDTDVAFVTYVDVPYDTLVWIREEINKIVHFDHIIFQQASAAISSNCGPGTFGVLYFDKSTRSYNIGSFFEDNDEEYDSEVTDEEYDDVRDLPVEDNARSEENKEVLEAKEKWYEKIEMIDSKAAITNSGSEEAFTAVLKIFYECMNDKYKELEKFYSDKDLENYTIKIHALKSSANLVGVLPLSEKAQLLENAGASGDMDYIEKNHESFMSDYKKLYDQLKEIYDKEDEDKGSSGDSSRDGENEGTLADEFILETLYEEIENAANNEDIDTINEIIKELSEYVIPEKERERYDEILKAAEKLDYETILNQTKKK